MLTLRRKQELEAQLVSIQKSYTAMDFNELRNLRGYVALKAQLIKVGDSLNLRNMALKAQLIKARDNLRKYHVVFPVCFGYG